MNLLSVIGLLLLLCKVSVGYKKGMVKELISFISLIVLCIVIALVSSGLQSYMEKEYLGVVIAVVLLALLGLAHHLLGVVLLPARLLVKLPVISWGNQLLGAVLGALETIILLWTVFLFAMKGAFGVLGQQILVYTQESKVLSWFYRYNFLAGIVEQMLEK